jgi:hypothetical protein
MGEKNIQKNILVIIIGLLTIYYIFDVQYLDIIAYSIGAMSIIFPAVAFGIDWLWGKIGFVMGWVNSKVILTVLFFFILFPIALLRRIFASKVLQLKKPADIKSLYKNRNHLYRKEDLADTW